MRGLRGGGARRAFIVLLTAGVVGSTAWLLFVSPVLGVRNVQIVGNLTVSTAEIEKRAAIPELQPLATVDLATVESRVRGIRKIARATAARSWPSTLTIEVVEREPVAVAPVGGGVALLDRGGVVIEVKAAAPPRLPVLKLATPGPGDPATRAALSVVDALPKEIGRRVDEVRAPSADGISLRLADGREVIWGGPERAGEKARVLVELLTREARVYDVSSPDVVTLK